MNTYTARYSGRLSPGRQPTKQIIALDIDCARKQAAYWFGCIPDSDRLTVTAYAKAKRWPTEAELQAESAALEAARGNGNTSHSYLIRSLERQADGSPSLFCAIHGFSPFYVCETARARRFASREEATAYALAELFTTPAAFEVVEV